MAKQATLTFGMDLSDFDKAMKAINRQTTSLSDQLEKMMQAPREAYKKANETLKINPFQSVKFHTDLEKLKNDLKKATTHRLNLDIEQAKKNIMGLKEEIITTLGSALVLSKPISSAISFESSMADVKKVVDFDTPAELKAFSGEIMKMSRTIPLSVSELASITASGGQLGIAKENLTDFTKTAAMMGVAFDMSAKDAGDNMAKLMNIFSLDVKKVGELGDTINHISNNSAAKANDIINSIGRIAGNAKDFGLSADATAGLASSFLALGKTPEVASTAINSMLTVLNNADNASKEVSEAFKQIGIDGKDLKQAILKYPQKALTAFLHTLSKIPKESKTGILTSIFGKNFGDDISLVTGAIENYDKAMRLSGDVGKKGSMQKEFQARSETTENNIQQMKNAFNEIAVNIGSVFLPALNSAIDVIKYISYAVSGFAEKFPNLIKYAFGATAAITALKTAMIAKQIATNGITLMLGNYRKILQNLPFDCLSFAGSLRDCNIAMRLKAVFTRMATASLNLYQKTLKTAKILTTASTYSFLQFSVVMGAVKAKAALAFGAIRAGLSSLMFNPVGLAVTAIVAGALLIYKFWQPIKAFFGGIWDGLKEGLAPTISIISAAFTPLKPLFDWVGDFFASLFSQSESTKESLEGFANVGRIVGNALAFVIDIILTPLQLISQAFKGLFKMISESSIGKWIGEKMGISLSDSDIEQLKALDTTGAVGEVVGAKQAVQNSQSKSTTNNITSAPTINMYGSSATPQAVAQAVTASGTYAFSDAGGD